MKINTTHKMAGALALTVGLAAAAQAQTVIYLTGSTAFRNQVQATLHSDMGLALGTGSTLNANAATFTGTPTDVNSLGLNLTGLGALTVECNMAGSAEGLFSILGNSTSGYLTAAGTADTCSYGADVTYSDVLYTTTTYASQLTTTFGVNGPTEISSPLAAANVTGVAIQPFGWFANAAAVAKGVNNMTPAIASALYGGNGTLSLNFWTGNAADSNTLVYAVGRTNDSGTRVTALVDAGLNFNTGVSQWMLTNGAVGTLSSPIKIGTNGWFAPVGNNGFASGGNVAYEIGDDTVTNLAVGYIGLADAFGNIYYNGSTTLTGSTAASMTFEGTSIGTFANHFNGLQAVVNGSYTFWSYEHQYLSAHGSGSAAATQLATAIAKALDYEIHHPVGVSIQTALGFEDMNVYRNADGGPVLLGN